MTTLNTSILGAFLSCDRCMTFGLALSWFAGTILQLTSATTLYGPSQDDSRHLFIPGALFSTVSLWVWPPRRKWRRK